MSFEDLSTDVSAAVLNSLAAFINFIPSLVGGLIVFVIGLVIAAVVYRAIVTALRAAQVEKYLAKYGITKVDGRDIEHVAERLAFDPIPEALVGIVEGTSKKAVKAGSSARTRIFRFHRRNLSSVR